MVSDAKLVFGTDTLSEGKPLFATMTQAMLQEEYAFLIEPKDLVIGVPGSITADEALEALLRHLKKAGYQVALTGYNEVTARLRFDRIITMFDYICINVRGMDLLRLKDLLRRLRRCRGILIAEGVDTEREFENVRELGFSMYRGDYLEPASTLQKDLPPLAESVNGKLLNLLLAESVDPDELLLTLQQEPILYYCLLLQTGEGNCTDKRVKQAVRERVLKYGPEDLRRWCCAVMLRSRNIHLTEELPFRAYLRGLFAERLMESSSMRISPRLAFLLGMFSLLDSVTGLQLEQLFHGIHLETGMKNALLGRGENEYTMLLQFLMVYEMRRNKKLNTLILPEIGLKLSESQLDALFEAVEAEAQYEFQLRFLIPKVYQGTIVR